MTKEFLAEVKVAEQTPGGMAELVARYQDEDGDNEDELRPRD